MATAASCTSILPATGAPVAAFVVVASCLVLSGVTLLLCRGRARRWVIVSAIMIASLGLVGGQHREAYAAQDCAASSPPVPASTAVTTTTTTLAGAATGNGVIVASDPPLPPAVVPEVPVPAMFGGMAIALFGFAVMLDRRRSHHAVRAVSRAE